MNYSEVLENARTCIGKYCKACPVCNGMACRNQMPGPGAKGVGDGAIRNYQKWQEIRVNMDTLCENAPVDASLEIFGKKFKYPFFAGPVGAVAMHYSDKYNDMTYNNVLVDACAKAGIAAFTGDGVNPAVMEGATAAIEAAAGVGVPTVKPWNLDTVREKMELVKKSGAFAVAMDVDAAGLPFLKNMTPPAGSKTVEELKEIVGMVDVPFIVKGIMTPKAALKAMEAVKKELKRLEKYYPDDFEVRVFFDATEFIKVSIEEVVFTLILNVKFTSISFITTGSPFVMILSSVYFLESRICLMADTQCFCNRLRLIN